MKKKLFLLTAVTLFSTSAIFSQSVVKENINEVQTVELQKFQSDDSIDARYSGTEANFSFVDAGFTYGMTLVFDKFFINSDFNSFFDDPVGMNTNAWNIGAGYNYRHYFGRSVYIDGRLGAQYSQVKIDFWDYGNYKDFDDYSDGSFDLFVMPKLGLRLAKGFAVTAGYKITFIGLEEIGGSFNVGLTLLM